MININLIAERRARKIREMTILRTSTLIAFSVALLMVLVNVYAMMLHLVAKNDLRTVEREIAFEQPTYQEVLKIEQEINQKEPLVNLLEQVQASESAWMTIMADLSRVVPKDVVIDRISSRVEDKQVHLAISGRARDEDAIAKFMLNLSELTAWSETPVLQSSDSMKANKEGGKPLLRFDLSVPVRGMIGGDL